MVLTWRDALRVSAVTHAIFLASGLLFVALAISRAG